MGKMSKSSLNKSPSKGKLHPLHYVHDEYENKIEKYQHVKFNEKD